MFQNTVDKLVQRANASIMVGTSSWKEQFIEAITVSGGRSKYQNTTPFCAPHFTHATPLINATSLALGQQRRANK